MTKGSRVTLFSFQCIKPAVRSFLDVFPVPRLRMGEGPAVGQVELPRVHVGFDHLPAGPNVHLLPTSALYLNASNIWRK